MDTDLQHIDYFKIISLFQVFKGRSVQINFVAAKTIPMWIENFDFSDYESQIAFGEFEDEDNWFYLKKDGDLNDVWYEYDDFTSEDNVIFKLEFDVFRNWIHVRCCLVGIEKCG